MGDLFVVAVSRLNLRDEPSLESQVIWEMRRNTLVEVLEVDESRLWYRVNVRIETQTHEGWMWADMLSPYRESDGEFASRIIRYMEGMNYVIDREQGKLNIVAVEGINPDGTPNKDGDNEFNDVLCVIEFGREQSRSKPMFNYVSNCTTEPGYFYTWYPMNPRGAARIDFGQYQAWQVGIHGTHSSTEHEALVQTGGTVTVRRDANMDMVRTNDYRDTGYFGINIHGGWNAPDYDIGRVSAGCIVIPKMDDFRAFMGVVKEDIRYRRSKRYVFRCAFLPGNMI